MKSVMSSWSETWNDVIRRTRGVVDGLNHVRRKLPSTTAGHTRAAAGIFEHGDGTRQAAIRTHTCGNSNDQDSTEHGALGVHLVEPTRYAALYPLEVGQVVEAVIRMDPITAQRITDLERDGWKFGYGGDIPYGITREDVRQIVFGYKGRESASSAVKTLIHEVRHARREGYKPKHISPTGLNRNEWIDRSLQERFRAEGDADIELRDARNRLIREGVPDIGLLYCDERADRIHDMHSRVETEPLLHLCETVTPGVRDAIGEADSIILRDVARNALGEIYAHVVPGNVSGQSYYSEYRSQLMMIWDDVVESRRPPQG